MLELREGNGIAALAQPITDVPDVAICRNGTAILAIKLATDEDWIGQDVMAAIRPANRPIVPMSESEEARILSHPDVAAAIETVLPEIEAWERA